MKMKLKNNSKKFDIKRFKKIITKKSFFIFILGFFLCSFIFGIIYFLSLGANYKESIYINITNSYTFTSYKYFEVFKTNLIGNTFNTILIWVFGISVIGIIFLLLILFSEGFGIGLYFIGAISKFGFKGIVLFLCHLFSGRIIYFLLIIFLIYKSCLFSYKLIKFLFFKRDIDMRKEFNKYLKSFVFSCLVSLVYTIIITFISPFIYKAFTFLIK